jgi:predicted polyphosphate/ATP-dependent NAD kinase
VSPIGAQGFLLGRGNQQISARVMHLVGAANLIIVSTPHKLAEIDRLLVDTGDRELDRALSGNRQVVSGYRIAQRKDVLPAEDIVSDLTG